MSNPLKWPGAAVLCTGIVAVGAVLIVCVLMGQNGFVMASGFGLIGTIVGGAVGHETARRRRASKEAKQPIPPSTDDLDITPPLP